MFFLISVHLATGGKNTGLKKSNYHQPIKSPDKKLINTKEIVFKKRQSIKQSTYKCTS